MSTLAAYLDRTDLSALKDYLGITTGDEDVQLRQWYGTAIDWCDKKLSRRDFLAADGFVDNAPPDQVITAVYEFVATMRGTVAQVRNAQRKNKTGAREDEYFGQEAGRVFMAGLVAWPNLEPWVEQGLGFSSAGGW